MSLFEIKNKLYRKREEKDLPETKDYRYSTNVDGLKKEEGHGEDIWEAPKKGLSERTKRLIKLGLMAAGALILVVAGFWGIYKFRQSAFADDRVLVSISGLSELRSGKKADYEVSFTNNNRTELRDAILKLSYPENFKPEELPNFKLQGPTNGIIELGTIKGHASGKFVFSGKAFSPKGSLIYIQAELIYTPSNFNSQFTSQKRLSVNISSSPVVLNISYPQAISNGDEVNYNIEYRNTGEEDFSNVSVRAEYPDGFSLISSDPEISGDNNNWYIGSLKAGSSGRLIIKGRLEGERNEVKNIKLSIGSYEDGNFIVFNEESAGVKLTASSLFVSQKVSNASDLIASAGDFLKFEIFYRNDGDIVLRDAIATERLVGDALDFSSLDLPNGGDYDSNAHSIIWKAVNYPELKNISPGQSGTISFTIRVKNPLPVKTVNTKNFIISSLAKVDSPDIPTPVEMNKIISSNTINIKVNSQLGLNVLGYYNDSVIPNSGPIPPKVDEETTYTIHWTITNNSNDLDKAKVEASLPTGISLTGKIISENENLKYNERTNLVTWDIGKLEAGTGITKSARSVAFQVKIRPSIDQVEDSPGILENSVFSGLDTFTSTSLRTEEVGKSINLAEDKGIGAGGDRVVN